MGEGGWVRGEVWRRVWTGSRIFGKEGREGKLGERGGGGEVRGGFKAVPGRGRGRDVRFECKVVVSVSLDRLSTKI